MFSSCAQLRPFTFGQFSYQQQKKTVFFLLSRAVYFSCPDTPGEYTHTHIFPSAKCCIVLDCIHTTPFVWLGNGQKHVAKLRKKIGISLRRRLWRQPKRKNTRENIRARIAHKVAKILFHFFFPRGSQRMPPNKVYGFTGIKWSPKRETEPKKNRMRIFFGCLWFELKSTNFSDAESIRFVKIFLQLVRLTHTHTHTHTRLSTGYRRQGVQIFGQHKSVPIAFARYVLAGAG